MAKIEKTEKSVAGLVSVILAFFYKKMPLNKYLKYCLCYFYIHLKIKCEIITM